MPFLFACETSRSLDAPEVQAKTLRCIRSGGYNNMKYAHTMQISKKRLFCSSRTRAIFFIGKLCVLCLVCFFAFLWQFIQILLKLSFTEHGKNIVNIGKRMTLDCEDTVSDTFYLHSQSGEKMMCSTITGPTRTIQMIHITLWSYISYLNGFLESV